MKNKETMWLLGLLLVVATLVAIGGYIERGYFYPASELLIIPVGLLGICERRKKYD